MVPDGSVTYFDTDGKPYAPDAVPLNEQGRAQADAAGTVFAQEGIRFDKVIGSGLPRTMETAQRVLTVTGQAIEPEHWPEFIEIRGGRLESIADDAVKDAFTGAFEGVVPEHKQVLGGETIGALMDRIHPAVQHQQNGVPIRIGTQPAHGRMDAVPQRAYRLAAEELLVLGHYAFEGAGERILQRIVGDRFQPTAADFDEFRPMLGFDRLAGYGQHALGRFHGARQAGHDHFVEADAFLREHRAGGSCLRAALLVQRNGVRRIRLAVGVEISNAAVAHQVDAAP